MSHAFSPWYISSWTNGDPYLSGFKFQTAALSMLCVMFPIQLSFVVNLLNVFLVWLPNLSLNLLLLNQCFQLLPVRVFFVSFLLPFAWLPCPLFRLHLSVWMFSFYVFTHDSLTVLHYYYYYYYYYYLLLLLLPLLVLLLLGWGR
jgi:hypothetical protein